MNAPAKKLDGLAKARAVRMANIAKRKADAAQPAAMSIDDEHEAPAAVHHQSSREPTRTGRAPPRGRSEAVGRNGEVLSRKRTSTGDIFAIPVELIPKDWEYQWAAVSVTGNAEILLDQNLMFSENGWRAVPSDRYPGRFMPVGHKGSIIRGGQMLMERPKSLCDEARAEDIRAAKQLMSDRNDALKLSGVRKQMGDGFEMSGKYRGTGGNIKMSIDPALDIPAPAHQLADPE